MVSNVEWVTLIVHTQEVAGSSPAAPTIKH